MSNNDPNPGDSSIPESLDDAGATEFAAHEHSGKKRAQIGPYKILQKIAEGGMGAVYMAQQTEPIKRRVAVKVIKAGQGTDQIIARFKAERQALAMMDHANISRIFDAGTTDEGSPYFVMELVNGIPLTKYCDNNKLSIRERLKLFVPVCKAVQHAHTKGIIHRDLKPSNVLVALYDGVPVPKVIDFGLAKATGHQQALTDETMFTEFGNVVGTVQYMSPEQAEMNQLDIDTRTDVYSLGVMLYELLTGSTPLDYDSMKQQAILKVLEQIRESEPQRPSTRLSASGDLISGVSDQRRIEPARLQKILRGELDWIVMRSLEKDRTRRYQSPSDFAQDISRFLNDEAVTARPPSRAYRLQKFIAKNRGVVYSLLSLATVLVAGVAVSTWFAVQAHRSAGKLEERNRELTEANIAAQQAADLAQTNEQSARQQSKLALGTLTSIIGDIQSGSKSLSGNGEIRRRLLKTSLAKLEQVSAEYIDQASVDHQTILALSEMGRVVMKLGTTENAGDNPGAEDTEVQSSAICLAQQFFERAHQMAQDVAGKLPQDVQAQRDLGISFDNLGDALTQLGDTQAALERYKSGLEIRQVLASTNKDNAQLQRDLSIAFDQIGAVRLQLGDTRAALKAYNNSLSIRESLASANEEDARLQRDLSIAFDGVGEVRMRLGDTQGAIDAYNSSLEIRQSLVSTDSDNPESQRDLSISYNRAGDLRMKMGDTQAALKAYEKGLEIRKTLVSADRNNTEAQRDLSVSFDKMGKVCSQLGDTSKALEAHTSSLKIRQSLASADKNNVVAQRDLSNSWDSIGMMQMEMGDTQAALKAHDSSLKIRQFLATADSENVQAQRDLSIAFDRKGDVRMRLGETRAALEAYNSSLTIRKSLATADKNNAQAQRDLSISFDRTGRVQLLLGDAKAALEAYNSSLSIRRSLALVDSDNAQTQRDLSISFVNRGNALKQLREMQAALKAYNSGLAIRQSLAADKDNAEAQQDLMFVHTRLGELFFAQGEYAKSIESFETSARLLRFMIGAAQRVENSKRVLKSVERQIAVAKTSAVALGDWDELLKQPVESLPALLTSRGIEFAIQKKFAEAIQAARKLRDLEGASSSNLYDVACVFALAASSVEPAAGEELTEEQSKQRSEWIAEALSSLKRAIEAGWDNLDHMRADSDLAVLRDLPEFKELSKSRTDEKP